MLEKREGHRPATVTGIIRAWRGHFQGPKHAQGRRTKVCEHLMKTRPPAPAAVASAATSPLGGLSRELDSRPPLGTRSAFTVPPSSRALANTLRSAELILVCCQVKLEQYMDS